MQFVLAISRHNWKWRMHQRLWQEIDIPIHHDDHTDHDDECEIIARAPFKQIPNRMVCLFMEFSLQLHQKRESLSSHTFMQYLERYYLNQTVTHIVAIYSFLSHLHCWNFREANALNDGTDSLSHSFSKYYIMMMARGRGSIKSEWIKWMKSERG